MPSPADVEVAGQNTSKSHDRLLSAVDVCTRQNREFVQRTGWPIPRREFRGVVCAREACQALKSVVACQVGSKDQDFPVEIVRYVPREAPAGRPLLLLGGMGPLAGLEAFGEALTLTPDRVVVLMQQCLVPDRSLVFTLPADAQHEARAELGNALAIGMFHGLQAVGGDGPIDLLVACNTAHAFVASALEVLARWQPAARQRLSFWPLMDSTVERAAAQGLTVIALYTDGSRRSGLYPERFRARDIPHIDPEPAAQLALMRAVYEGVKASDRESALHWGTIFCEKLDAQLDAFDASTCALLAGCTEIPKLIEWLRADRQSVPAVAKWLGCDILDPVALTLGNVAKAS